MTTVPRDATARPRSRLNMPSQGSNDNTEVINVPPTLPVLRGLTLAERNAVRRTFEKAMYQYLMQHGMLSTEVCGPCKHTETPYIRHPLVKKCALCFRAHDVCEIWDESIENIGRRRAHSKRCKRDMTIADAKDDDGGCGSLRLDQWAAYFKETEKELSGKLRKREEDVNQRLRSAMFSKKLRSGL